MEQTQMLSTVKQWSCTERTRYSGQYTVTDLEYCTIITDSTDEARSAGNARQDLHDGIVRR